MNDTTVYTNPDIFNRYRFLGNGDSEPSRITETSSNWMFWGRGRLLCYVLPVHYNQKLEN